MAVREIITYPNQILRKPTVAVVKIDKNIRVIIADMIDTLKEAHGLGLAANQIGVQYRILVYDEGNGPRALLNPKIVSYEGEQVGPEGCLSFPGLQGEVCRSEKIEVRGNDIKNKPIKIKAESLLARILQHEIDHLNGTVFIDRADPDTLHYITADDEESADEAVEV